MHHAHFLRHELPLALLLFITSLFLHSPSVHAASYNDTHVLLTNLFTDYDTDTRPLLDQNQILLVNFTLIISSTLEVDVPNQKIGLNAYVAFTWFDENLQWTPSDYGGLTEISVLSNRLWKPYLNLQNSLADSPQSLLDTSTSTPLTVRNNGAVFWWNYAPMVTVCKLDMTYFPLDRHSCDFSLVSIGYDNKSLLLSSYFSKPYDDMFISNGEWEVEATNFVTAVVTLPTLQDVYMLVTYIQFRRLPGFFVLNLLFPTCALSFLNILVFILPAESGEKIGYSMTVLLSVMLQLGLTSEFLPKSSDKIPLITQYLTILTVISILSSVATVFILVLHHKTEEEKKEAARAWGVLVKFMKPKRNPTNATVANNLKNSDPCSESDGKASSKARNPFWRWKNKASKILPNARHTDSARSSVVVVEDGESTKTSTTNLDQSTASKSDAEGQGSKGSTSTSSPTNNDNIGPDGDKESCETPPDDKKDNDEDFKENDKTKVSDKKDLAAMVDHWCFIIFSVVWLLVTIAYLAAIFIS